MSASKQRLIKRWSNLKQPILNQLKCYICDYIGQISFFRILKANDIFEAGELIRYKCPKCGVIFGDLRFITLSSEEIGYDYTDLYSFYHEGDTTNYIITALKTLELFKDKTKSYLDYACGKWNGHLAQLKNEGYNIVGYDKFVTSDKVLKDLGQNKYDVIFCNNYIEHVIEPYQDVKKMLDHLLPNGFLILMTSCFDYCYEYTHYHTFFFVDRSFQVLCDRLGTELIHSEKITFPNGEFTTVKVIKVKNK